MVCGKCWKEYSESDLIKVSDEEFVFYQYPNANHAAAIDFEAYFGFFWKECLIKKIILVSHNISRKKHAVLWKGE